LPLASRLKLLGRGPLSDSSRLLVVEVL
jgi:hypothetical protein